MANPQGPGTGSQRPSKQREGTFRPEQQGSDEDQTRQAPPQRQRTGSPERGADADREVSDRVEIGEPVPEPDRTIKADRVKVDRGDSTTARGGQGETGEDEDLPDDEGVEGTRGEKH